MPSTSSSRTRGAQPRNLNALKHGFYSRQFQSGEITDLETCLASGLQDEISMLRVITRRVFSLANGASTLGESINPLGALGLSVFVNRKVALS